MRLVLGVFLSLLPRRWRNSLRLEYAIPWEHAAILSGVLEFLAALVAAIYWYSHSVTTWAANALDSALRGGVEAQVPGQAIGFSALVLWLLHPLTWLIGYFAVEGLVRFLAAVSTEQVLPSWPLLFADWAYGKATHRPPEGDSLHMPSGREQLRGFAAAVKQSAKIARLPNVPDQVLEFTEGPDQILEIRASRPKPEWIPPKVVRIGAAFYRLESTAEGKSERPFIFRLRRLAAGVPGRAVLLYDPPPKP